jgi:hypothetical protein
MKITRDLNREMRHSLSILPNIIHNIQPSLQELDHLYLTYLGRVKTNYKRISSLPGDRDIPHPGVLTSGNNIPPPQGAIQIVRILCSSVADKQVDASDLLSIIASIQHPDSSGDIPIGCRLHLSRRDNQVVVKNKETPLRVCKLIPASYIQAVKAHVRHDPVRTVWQPGKWIQQDVQQRMKEHIPGESFSGMYEELVQYLWRAVVSAWYLREYANGLSTIANLKI